jgi:UDP-GlcNAc:undecaprenyl-phosphate GlcNAc-1-phosphate transferase
LAVATIPLAGCLLAFLRYNFNPASIFLGDCGSLTIGFMLGCFGLIWSRRTGNMLGLAAPLMTLALPLIDVCLSIARRYLRSAPIFKGDRGHIHHMMLARGFNTRAATLMLYGVCVIAAFLALMQTFGNFRFHGLIIIVFVVLVCVGVNYLGYIELTAARRILSRKMLLSVVKEEVYLQELTQAVSRVTTVPEYWNVVLAVCKDMNFTTVNMQIHGVDFEEVLQDKDASPSWNVSLSLGPSGSLRVTRTAGREAPGYMMRALVHLQKLIEEKELSAIPTPSATKDSASISLTDAA